MLATSFGQELAQEVTAAGAGFLVASDGQSVCKPLLKAGNKPILTHWLEKLATVPRMLPFADKVYVVTNADHLGMFQHWAADAGFPLVNILSNGAQTNASANTA